VQYCSSLASSCQLVLASGTTVLVLVPVQLPVLELGQLASGKWQVATGCLVTVRRCHPRADPGWRLLAGAVLPGPVLVQLYKY
jgi:hypothetical protein